MPEAAPSYVLPCVAEWEDFIYLIEITDRVLGYDPLTATEGVSNRQGTQLGNRTLWLRKFLDTEHVDGHHSLKDVHFLDGTKIPESALKLDYHTDDLDTRIRELKDAAEHTEERASSLTNVNLSFCGVMLRLIPYSQEYSGAFCQFDLFTDRVSLRPFGYTRIIEEIKGDDSLDVESTEGLVEGQKYLLMDLIGGDVEEVELMSILTDRRVRFTTELRHNRNGGYLASTNLLPHTEGARATRNFIYLSDWVTATRNAVSGKVIVNRDADESMNVTVRYQLRGRDDWKDAGKVLSRNYVDGSMDDYFEVPAGELRLRIEGDGGTFPTNVHYIAVKPDISVVWLEDVRQPQVVSVTYDGGKKEFSVTGNPYASLYDIEQASVDARLSTSTGFSGAVITHTIYDAVTGVPFAFPEEFANEDMFHVQLRYTDIEGTSSRWSAAYEVRPAAYGLRPAYTYDPDVTTPDADGGENDNG